MQLFFRAFKCFKWIWCFKRYKMRLNKERRRLYRRNNWLKRKRKHLGRIFFIVSYKTKQLLLYTCRKEVIWMLIECTLHSPSRSLWSNFNCYLLFIFNWTRVPINVCLWLALQYAVCHFRYWQSNNATHSSQLCSWKMIKCVRIPFLNKYFTIYCNITHVLSQIASLPCTILTMNKSTYLVLIICNLLKLSIR